MLDFEKQERAKEVAELGSQKQEKTTEVAKLNQAVSTMKQELMITTFKQVRAEEAVEKAREEGIAVQRDNEKLEQKQTTLQSDNQALKQMQDKLQKDNAQLEIQQEKLRSSIDQMVQSEKLLQRDVRKYDEEPEWQLPETGAFASTKSFGIK